MGRPEYDPIWAAATKHDITVSCHLARGAYETLPMPPVGFPSYNHDFMVTYSLLAANQVMSLIFDGVFDRFPTLRIVFVEHAFSWILPLMWRMDAIYEARKSWLDIKRKPTEYVKEHIKFTTQPLDYPEDKTELTRALEWMECDKILLFSSDYPHWTFDDPRWLVKHLPERARERGDVQKRHRDLPPSGARCRPSRARCGCSECREEAKRPRLAQGREHVVATVERDPAGDAQDSCPSAGTASASTTSTGPSTPSPTTARTRADRCALGVPAAAPSWTRRAAGDAVMVRDLEFIYCPWHQWGFELATGTTAVKPEWSIRTYPVRVVGKDVLVMA